jgi:hypothetical protein
MPLSNEMLYSSSMIAMCEVRAAMRLTFLIIRLAGSLTATLQAGVDIVNMPPLGQIPRASLDWQNAQMDARGIGADRGIGAGQQVFPLLRGRQ